jgi:hypothetical protein
MGLMMMIHGQVHLGVLGEALVFGLLVLGLETLALGSVVFEIAVDGLSCVVGTGLVS